MPKHVSTKELFISWKRMLDVGLYNIHLLLCAWKPLPLFLPYHCLMCVSGIMLLSKSACHCQNVFTFHETWAHRMVHFISKSCQFYWMICHLLDRFQTNECHFHTLSDDNDYWKWVVILPGQTLSLSVILVWQWALTSPTHCQMVRVK